MPRYRVKTRSGREAIVPYDEADRFAYRGYLIYKHPWRDDQWYIERDGHIIYSSATSREQAKATVDDLV